MTNYEAGDIVTISHHSDGRKYRVVGIRTKTVMDILLETRQIVLLRALDDTPCTRKEEPEHLQLVEKAESAIDMIDRETIDTIARLRQLHGREDFYDLAMGIVRAALIRVSNAQAMKIPWELGDDHA